MKDLNMERETKPRKKAAKALAGFMSVMMLLTISSRMLENFSMAEVTITRATSGSLERVLETNGTIKISDDEPIKAGDAFTVQKVHVRIGDTVEAGAQLVTVDIDLLKEKLAQAQIDLKKKELAIQSAKISAVATTPEELLANALRSREEADRKVAENVTNADLAVVEAEETLALNKKLLERSITKGLTAAEGVVASAKEKLEESVNTSKKAYAAAQKKYSDMMKPDTGIWATKKLEAYNAYIKSEIALADAIEERSAETDYTSEEAKKLYNGFKDQAKNEKLLNAYKERDKALNYYNEVQKETAPDILEQIDNALTDQTNKQKAYEKAVKDGNVEVTAALETLSNTKRAKTLWEEGTLVSNEEQRPADIETALKNAESAAKALTKAQKDREKLLKDNITTIEDADKALEKARKDAARQTKTDRISTQTKNLDNTVAEAELEKAKKSVERLKKLVETKGKITAPIAGTVSEITASEGAAIVEGAVIARIATGKKSMKIVATVTADEAKQLKTGLEAELYLDRMWATGKVADIRRAAGTGSQTGGLSGGQTMYEVHIGINPDQGDFFIGDSVRVTIRQTSQRYNTIIPLNALREDADGKFVFVLEEQSGALGTKQIVRRIDVKVQESNAVQAAVSGAFSDWEKLVERGDRELKNGYRVRVKQ
jgi:multidrug efflux pump subunit AcrA (membrane-fusion protein)